MFLTKKVSGLANKSNIEIDRESSKLRKESYDNLYKFCDNQPLLMVDEYGLGRRLSNGGGNSLHWYIIIDDWYYNPKKCCYVNIGATEYHFSAPNLVWGAVATVLMSPSVIKRVPTLGTGFSNSGPAQDISAAASIMASSVPYQLIVNNCQHMALSFMHYGMSVTPPGRECL